MEGRGRGRMGAGPHRRVMAVTRCVFLVMYLCCRLVFVCPRCGALIPCSRRRVLVLCCCCASSLYVVVAHNRQRQTTTNVIIHHLVPDVSELGWDGMGGGGCLLWCRIIVRHLGATSQQQHGTWFPFMGAGGFRGGGSHFCARGHPFVLVLGCMLLFGWSSLLSGRPDDDERRIQIHCSSTGSYHLHDVILTSTSQYLDLLPQMK